MLIPFIFLNLFMFLGANAVAYRYHRDDAFAGHLITLCLLYLGQVAATLLFLGIVIRTLGAVPIFVVNSAVSILLILLYRRHMRQSLLHFYRRSRQFISHLWALKDFFLYLVLIIFVTQVIILLVKIVFFPPQVWDSFAYHLPPLADWLQRDMITSWIDSPVIRMNRNPLGSKLFHFWILRFMGDITWIELPQFFYGLITMLCAYAVMTKMAVKRASALRYAVLIHFIPLILIGSRTCQDHLVLTGATMMVLYYFLHLFYFHVPTGHKVDTPDIPRLMFFGIAVGILLSIKISSPQIIAVFFLGLLFSRGFSFASVMRFIGAYRWHLGTASLIALLLGGYWYVRSRTIINLYVSRISPFLRDYGGILPIIAVTTILATAAFILLKRKIPKGRLTIPQKHKSKLIAAIVLAVVLSCTALFLANPATIINVVSKYKQVEPKIVGPHYQTHYPNLKTHDSQFFKNLLVFPFRIKDIGNYTAYAPDFLKQSGFGIQFFVFGLTAFLIMIPLVIFKSKYRRSVEGFLVIYAVLLLLSYFTYYFSDANYRMFIFFPVIGLILWASFLERQEIEKVFRIYLDLLLVGMLIFNFAACLWEGNMDIYRLKTALTIDNPLDRTSAKFTPLLKGPDWQFIDAHLSPQEPIGYLGHYDSWTSPYHDSRLLRPVYHLRRFPGFSIKPVKNNRLRLFFTPEFQRSLKTRNIHYIHINPQGIRMATEDRREIIIDCNKVVPVVPHLYYFKW